MQIRMHTTHWEKLRNLAQRALLITKDDDARTLAHVEALATRKTEHMRADDWLTIALLAKHAIDGIGDRPITVAATLAAEDDVNALASVKALALGRARSRRLDNGRRHGTNST